MGLCTVCISLDIIFTHTYVCTYMYTYLSLKCRVLSDVEAMRQEANLLREQMDMVKGDIRKVRNLSSFMANARWYVPFSTFLSFLIICSIYIHT